MSLIKWSHDENDGTDEEQEDGTVFLFYLILSIVIAKTRRITYVFSTVVYVKKTWKGRKIIKIC